jgi:serine/threonine protein kinase/lipopolysaccharide biosynthesis regulator YciM
LSKARRIDEGCNRFERAWQAGPRPRLEDYLGDTPEPERAALLRELIALDMAYRRQAGEQPQAAEYHARFPDLAFSLTPTRADPPSPGTLERPQASAALPDVPGYEILQELGRGGMGVVYWAWQTGLHRPVALKMVLAGAHAGPNELARFRTEAEAAARLQHAHIVQIHDIGQHEGRPYLALEYVDGGSLARKLDGTPWPAARAVQLIETLARAIEHAHRQGVVHRDLKPGNVLLTKEGQPKVTDFGLAKLLVGGGDPLTRTGAILGTPSYMAPEQAEGKTQEMGPATDVYALGAILYELLTGRPPLKAATPLETVRQVVTTEPVPPRRLQPGVPRDVETVCLKCLHKPAARRYATAEELAEDLCRFQAGEPIVARPVGHLERGWKWARRRPAAAALVGVTVLALAGGVTGVLWYADRERDRANQESALRREADDQRDQAQTVLHFFQNQVLAAARPAGQEGGLGIDATIRDAVHAAEPKIAGTFRDRPLVEASIRNMLGVTYWYLREDQAAIAQYVRALALRQEMLGPDHPDTLQSLGNLATAYQGVGQATKALPLREQVLAKHQATLGPDHPDTLISMNNLAMSYKAAGQLDKALSLFEQTLAKSRERFGPDHPETLASMNNLAMSYKAAGRMDQALPLLEQASALRREKLGPDHHDTLESLSNLATAYQAVGQATKALPLREQVLAKCRATLGPDHPDTLISMNNLAMSYKAAGQLDKALPLFEQTLAKSREKLGPDHPETLGSMNNLASAYQAADRLDKALPLFEQTLAKYQEQLGPEHPHTLTSMNNLAYAYQAIGQLDRALSLFEQALTKLKEKLGPDHPTTLATMDNLSRAYKYAGQVHKALPLVEQVLAKRQEQLGANHPDTIRAMNNLAGTYWAVGQRDKALPLLEQALMKFKERPGPDHPDTLQCMNNLAAAYQEHGDFAKAEPILRECLTHRQQKQPEAWLTLYTQSQLGASLLGQKQYAAAEPLLLAGYEGMKQREAKIPAVSKKNLTEALDRLVELYDAWGKPDQAARWRAEREKLPKPPEPPKAKSGQ